jgi:mycothiol synthase
MRVEPLGHERLADFVKYCLKHRKEVDESFLYDEDLHAFRPGKDNPTYVLVDVQGELIGVASLIP